MSNMDIRYDPISPIYHPISAIPDMKKTYRYKPDLIFRTLPPCGNGH